MYWRGGSISPGPTRLLRFGAWLCEAKQWFSGFKSELLAAARPISLTWSWRVLSCCSRAPLLVLVATLIAKPAAAVPAFAIQTGQPCAACHVGAFGPQLKPYGRDFKLHGYVASDGQDHGLPLAMTTQTSFTHTAAPQAGGAAPGFRANDNFALDQMSLYYAGKIAPHTGGFIELEYDGVAKQAQIGNVDIRHVREGQLFGQDVLWGFTGNNNPTVQDPWNSTPAWGFPYNGSALAPTPMAATLVDGGLGQRVGGLGGYMVWNNSCIWRPTPTKGSVPMRWRRQASCPCAGADLTRGVIPYGRLALMQDGQNHHVELGAYGLAADIFPGGVQQFGLADHFADVALDANYQFIVDPSKVTSDMLSAHATYIHETGRLEASQALAGALLDHTLDTFRFDVSYSFAATVTPTFQYFRTTGTADANYWATPNGSPNSEGMIFELAYVPLGQAGFALSRLQRAARRAICGLSSFRRQPRERQPQQQYFREPLDGRQILTPYFPWSVALSIRPFAVLAILTLARRPPCRLRRTIAIDQRGLVFNVSSESLQRGDRLIFNNSDDVTHNIHIFTGDDDDVADLGLQKPGREADPQIRRRRPFHRPLQHPSLDEDDGQCEIGGAPLFGRAALPTDTCSF